MLAASAHLVELLRHYPLLEPGQLDEVLGPLQARFPEARALARELVQRGWLTPYQANRLFQDGGAELVVGQYVLLDRVGSGGMGDVFRARQRGLARTIALKVIRKERLANPDAVRRFYREAQAAAQLDHPNVVRAYDAGEAGGTHYLAMEFVDGIDLARLVRQEGPLPVATACDYVRQTALGLQHAWERGLTHRDIKPGNLLLVRGPCRSGTWSVHPSAPSPSQTPDATHLVKILDLGLARLQPGCGGDESGSLTATGVVMGTPDYIAPEQARDARDVDVRADLYSLGCSFYFLLTAQVPFPGGNLTTKLLSHQLEEPRPVEEVRPGVPAAVGAVVRKLMAKRPEDRYQTPAELAAVLAALAPTAALAATPARGAGAGTEILPAVPAPAFPEDTVGGQAPPAPSTAETLPPPDHQPWRRKQRRPWLAVLLVLIPAALALVFFLVLFALMQAPGPLPPPEPVTVTAEAGQPWQDTGVDVVKGDRLSFTCTGSWGKGPGSTCDARGFAGSPRDRAVLPEAPLLCLLGRVAAGEPFAAAGTQPVSAPASGRLFLRVNDLDLAQNSGSLQVEIKGGRHSEEAATPPPPTRREAAEAALVESLRREADPHADRAALRTAVLALVRDHAGSPQAEEAAWLQRRLDSPLSRIDPSALAPYEKTVAGGGDPAAAPPELVAILGDSRLKHWAEVRAVAFSPDGGLLASAGDDCSVKLWDPATGKEARTLSGHSKPVLSVAWSSDGRLLASGGQDASVILWDPATGKKVRTLAGLRSAVAALAWSPANPQLLAGGDSAGGLRLWDGGAGWKPFALKGHKSGIHSLAWSPDGKRLASGGKDKLVRLWHPDSPDEFRSLTGHGAAVRAVAFSPDGNLLASAAGTVTVILWETQTWTEQRRLAAASLTALSFSSDGQYLAGSSSDGSVAAWDPATGNRLATLPGYNLNAESVAFRPGSALLAVGTTRHHIRLWDVAAGRELTDRTGERNWVRCLAFHPNGKLLASGGSWDSRVWLHDAVTGRSLPSPWGHPTSNISALAFTPDGQLASGCADDVLKLGDPLGKQAPRNLAGNTGGCQALAASHDGKLLACGGVGYQVRLWRTDSAAVPRLLKAPTGGIVRGLAFSPDDKLLASAGEDRKVLLWDVRLGWLLRTLDGPAGPLFAVAFSTDGKLVAAGGADQKVWLWEAATGKKVATLTGHDGAVRSLAFSPDGRLLASSAADGTVRLWQSATWGRRQVLRLAPPGGNVFQVVFAADARHLATANGNGTLYILRLPVSR